MENVAGWMFFVLLIIVNTVCYILIDGYFEGDIEGLKEDSNV